MSETTPVFPVKIAICCQVVVLHILALPSSELEISVFPSPGQARQKF
jgi:hypothetical protein